jgi:glycosyltransferase involved in cell wall biosynthesis
MNIFILTNEPFPIGMAATNRIISYARGIAELSHHVKVLCLRPTESESRPVYNPNIRGEYNGIHFEYVSGTTIWPKNKLLKLFYVTKGYYNSIKLIYGFNKINNINCLLLVSNRALNIIIFFLLSRILNLPYIQEKSEYPFVLLKKTLFGRIYAYFYVTCIYKLFDGMIIMTNPLLEYFKSRVRKNAKLIVVPMTVEPERFIGNTSKINESSRYIAYCGSLAGNKDGIPILIDAFQRIADKYEDVKLYIIGNGADSDNLGKLKAQVSRLNLEGKVVFTGKVHRDDMPHYLCNASALALARPSGLQSHGGFPTKLGEYLSTGNPVAVTNVGEISRYLTDGVNAFIAEPDSAAAFAEKLDYILSNAAIAEKIGLSGREVVLSTFTYKVQSKRIVEFIDQL